ncbi:ABC transporter ATP-binding protein [Pseudonocardiaceae bacterium YIM PH 21723]|nr:ABC transporter ATP-binding protein [Pseudonocardiaceae bacterium YIM PH 21723]
MTTAKPRTGKDILRIALRRNVAAMAAGTALMGMYQAAETAFPIALGEIVELALRERSLRALGLSILGLGVLITIVSLSWRHGMRVLQKANTTEAHRWRVQVAAAGLEPMDREHGLRSGEVLTVATEDADQTADIIEVVPLLVSAVIAVVIAAIALGLASIWLGLLVIAGATVNLTILSLLSKKIGSSTQEQQARVARAAAKVADLIGGLRPLHGFGGNHAAFRSYRRISTEAKQQAITVAGVNGGYTGIGLALNAILAAAVTLTAGWLAFDRQISVGQLVMAVGLSQFIMEPLRLFSEMPKYIMIARASAERLALVLAAPSPGTAGREPVSAGATLEVAELSYGALSGLDFRVPAGEFVAIAAYDPGAAADLAAVLAVGVRPDRYTGSVRIDGASLDELSVAAVRGHMLVNPAHAEIFAGTLRSNIDPSGVCPDVDPAVYASMLTDVVALHRDGLEHVVADRGTNLSGGQRQRLSLARALAAAPEILVLHDPTTAVDAVTEQLIARRIADLRRGRTTVVLTSSPALLDVADRVLVLDGGTVAGEGTHRDLLTADDAYRVAVTR